MKTDAWGVCMGCVESNARSEREQTSLTVGGNLDRDDPEFDILTDRYFTTLQATLFP
jgi:hypothetical protein